MKLTHEQEDLVRANVIAHGLKLKTLCDDVIDHICCVIESESGKGKSFDQLLDDAIADLAPDGLIYLEHKTIFLLNAKRILIMKKLTYLIGFIGWLLVVADLTTHGLTGELPGHIGVILLLAFIPLLAFDRYKVAIAKTMSERLAIVLGIIGACLYVLGFVVKTLHAPGAGILLTLGITVFSFGFIPFLFYTMYRKSVS